jgi:uncharacterized protein with HEPN domain
MQQPKSPSLLWDARNAARQILDFTTGKTLEDYVSDTLLRSGVERQFTIMGEALSKLRQSDSATAERLSDLPQIVGFRNILVHGYADVEDRTVWQTMTTHLGQLISAIDELLAEGQSGSSALGAPE